MLIRCYGIYDSKAQAFLQPFWSRSNGDAMRNFEDVAKDVKTPIGMHPGDYQLYEIGSFDDQDGRLSHLEPTKLLCNGADYVPVVAQPAVQQVWPAVGSVPAAVSNNQ